MSAPLAGVILATARICLQRGIALKVAHVAGHKNHWADVLSRGRQKDPRFWDQLSMARADIWIGQNCFRAAVPRPKCLMSIQWTRLFAGDRKATLCDSVTNVVQTD